MVGEEKFREIYFKNLSTIDSYFTESMFKGMMVHDLSYGRIDLKKYYEIEWKKYYESYCIIASHVPEGGTICDCGGFLGVFAVTMADLGYKVSIVEALKYYDDVFDELYSFMRSKNINAIDYDMFDISEVISLSGETFDCVCSMDVIEHYPYSLKHYMENLKALAKKFIFITAPNIAVFHKRLNLLLDGVTPLANITEVYNSAVPFTGHHHEMTMYELEKIAELAELHIVEKMYNSCYFYGEGIRNTLYKWIHKHFPNTRENLGILLEK